MKKLILSLATVAAALTFSLSANAQFWSLTGSDYTQVTSNGCTYYYHKGVLYKKTCVSTTCPILTTDSISAQQCRLKTAQ